MKCTPRTILLHPERTFLFSALFKRSIIGLSTCFVLASCSSMKPGDFAHAEPKFNPISFFNGRTHSGGVMENRAGKPLRPIVTKTQGTLKNGTLSMEQDLMPEGQEANHRSWKLWKVDEHHFDATANDISGSVHGEVYGNYLSWQFRVKVAKHGLIKHVHMQQHMYLMPDGQTLLIRSIISKFGFTVQQVTERFKKE